MGQYGVALHKAEGSTQSTCHPRPPWCPGCTTLLAPLLTPLMGTLPVPGAPEHGAIATSQEHDMVSNCFSHSKCLGMHSNCFSHSNSLGIQIGWANGYFLAPRSMTWVQIVSAIQSVWACTQIVSANHVVYCVMHCCVAHFACIKGSTPSYHAETLSPRPQEHR